jgi:hypothetical protein
MSIDKWGPGLNAIFAILATIGAFAPPLFPWTAWIATVQWPLLLVVLGFIHGTAVPVRDHASMGMLIVGAAFFPTLADYFDVVPVVGPYLNQWVDFFAIAMAGYVVASLLHEVKARVFSDQRSTHY